MVDRSRSADGETPRPPTSSRVGWAVGSAAWPVTMVGRLAGIALVCTVASACTSRRTTETAATPPVTTVVGHPFDVAQLAKPETSFVREERQRPPTSPMVPTAPSSPIVAAKPQATPNAVEPVPAVAAPEPKRSSEIVPVVHAPSAASKPPAQGANASPTALPTETSPTATSSTAIPKGAAPSQVSGRVSPAWHDVSIIPPKPLAQEKMKFPTVIYRKPTLAVAVPIEVEEEPAARGTKPAWQVASTTSKTWVQSVLLRKRTGPDQGTLLWKPVQSERATFQDLTNGAYDVYYLRQPCPASTLEHRTSFEQFIEGHTPPQRRIIIELVEVPKFTFHKPWSDLSPEESRVLAASSTGADGGGNPLDHVVVRAIERRTLAEQDAAVSRSERGWSLLAKGSFFNARREFLSVLLLGLEREREQHPVSSQFTAREILEASAEVASACLGGKTDPKTLSMTIVMSLGRRPVFAEPLYGLAKVYDAMCYEADRTLAAADLAALVCYQAAAELDPSRAAVFNDLGVLLYRMGRRQDAIVVLRRAARAESDPRFASNLARVHFENGDLREAFECLSWALTKEPDNRAALAEWLRASFVDQGRAIYGEDCREFAQHLGSIVECFDPQAQEAAVARQALRQLWTLGKELELNRRDLVGAVWLHALTQTPSALRPAAHTEIETKPGTPAARPTTAVPSDANRPAALPQAEAVPSGRKPNPTKPNEAPASPAVSKEKPATPPTIGPAVPNAPPSLRLTRSVATLEGAGQ